MQFSKNKDDLGEPAAQPGSEETRKYQAAYKPIISIPRAHALGHKKLHYLSNIQYNTTTVVSEVS